MHQAQNGEDQAHKGEVHSSGGGDEFGNFSDDGFGAFGDAGNEGDEFGDFGAAPEGFAAYEEPAEMVETHLAEAEPSTSEPIADARLIEN